MTLGYGKPLYILAFDHRGSFKKKMFGIDADPTPEQAAKIADAKELIFEGFADALAQGAPKDAAGVLVDEEAGAKVAQEAKAAGYMFAMPVEKSGQDEFDFEYGAAFGKHVEDFEPTFVKVLVRYNPHGDAATNTRQVAKLKELSDWLHANGRKFLFELLVPAEPSQLESVGGDVGLYDSELRPSLMVTTLWELQELGIEPDIWKIEGIGMREDCVRVAEQARAGGRDGVACVVLGRGADDDAVVAWLKAASGVPGYIGFAIGRTIWWDALKGFLDGSVQRADASKQIAANYLRMIQAYTSG